MAYLRENFVKNREKIWQSIEDDKQDWLLKDEFFYQRRLNV